MARTSVLQLSCTLLSSPSIPAGFSVICPKRIARSTSFHTKRNLRNPTWICRSLKQDKPGGWPGSRFSDHDAAECHVQTISWRERLIKASILVEASPQKVWKVLTNYEQLSEFIPNLVCSKKIPCPYPGRTWLLQRGVQRTMYWNIEAFVILDLKEFPNLESGSELHFSMIDGDFKRYDGRWYLRNGPRPQTTVLHYEVNVVPKLFFPPAFVERVIKADLPKNLNAIAKRAEMESENCGIEERKATQSKENHTPENSNTNLSSVLERDKDEASSKQLNPAVLQKEDSSGIIDGILDELNWTSFGRTCQLGRQCFVDEIHFRRLDDPLENGGVRRQVAASITVKSPLKDVWNVLTSYESLPEFVPNLTKSVVLYRNRKNVRLLQEGCKCLLYMVLHARVVLDIFETPEQEIVFKQVEGDFDFFEGTWNLSQLGSEHTILKYTVDTRIRKDSVLPESIVEEVIYEDLPSNLCAIRDRVESLIGHIKAPLVTSEVLAKMPEEREQESRTDGNLESSESEITTGDAVGSDSGNSRESPPTLKAKKKRTNLKKLMNDFGVLEKEIRGFITSYGTEGVMPLRKQMRQHGRSDLEKAITAMGGFRIVASRLKLQLAYKERKPDGYWDDVQNLRNEIIAVQKELGEDASVLPSRLSIEKLGYYHLARAFEKWGGAKEAAKILGLKTRTLEKREKIKKEKFKQAGRMDRKERRIHESKKSFEEDSKNSVLKESHENLTRLAFPEILVASEQSGASPSTSQYPSEEPVGVVCEVISSIEEAAQNESYPTQTNQVRQKKKPYKTEVPQDSSKWLTLFTDPS